MNFKQIVFSLGLALAGTSLAHAQEAHSLQHSPPARTDGARFSEQGRMLVAGSVNGHWSSRPGDKYGWAVNLSPSLGYFVRDRLAVGLLPGYSTGYAGLESWPGTSRFHELSLATYALYDLSLAERISLLLIPSIGYAYRRQPQSLPPTPILAAPPGNFTTYSLAPDSRHSVRLSLHAPVVYHLSSSVVLGLGPYVSYDRLVGDAAYRTVTVGRQEFPGQASGFSPFTPDRNTVEVGLSSFIGASF